MDNELEEQIEIKLYKEHIIIIFLILAIIVTLIFQFRYVKKYKQYITNYDKLNNEYIQKLADIELIKLDYKEKSKQYEELKIIVDNLSNNNSKLIEENNMLNWYIATYGIVNGTWKDFEKDINNGG